MGLIAFGVGLVLGSLAPASDAEQQLAAAAESKAKQLAGPAKQLGQDMAEQLKPAVQGAVEEVRSTAQATTEQAKVGEGRRAGAFAELIAAYSAAPVQY